MDGLTPGMRRALIEMAGREGVDGRKWGPIHHVHKSSLYALERRGLAVRNGYMGVAKLTDEGFRLAESLTPKNDDGAASPPADSTGAATPTAAESATAKAAPSSPTHTGGA